MNIYDFDGTIYAGDSSIDFIKFCFKKNKKCLLLIPKYIIAIFLYILKIYDKEEMKSVFFSIVKYFKNIDDVVLAFWDKYENKLKKIFIDKKEEQNIVVSASPEFLLKPILNKYKFKVIATKVDPQAGKLISANCYGKEKVARLKEEGIIECDNFYSDSFSDEPVANISKNAFIVKGNETIKWDEYKHNNKILIKTNRILNNKFLMVYICFAFALSISLLSVYLMISKITPELITITFITSFITSYIFIYVNRIAIFKNIICNHKINLLSLIITIIICYTHHINDYYNTSYIDLEIIKINHFHIFVYPAVFLLISILIPKIISWFLTFWHSLDVRDKRNYKIVSIIISIIVIILYISSGEFYLQFDRVYSIDSGWVYGGIFPDLYYYDIRHPLMSIFTFPIFSIGNLLFNPTFKAIFYQLINIQLLIIIGFELQLLTKNKYVFWLYIVSFPSVIYSLFFEKYIFIVFLLVTYLYNTFYKHKKIDIMYILATMVMPTSIFMGIVELFKTKNIIRNLKNIFSLIIIAFIITIYTGRIYCVRYGLDNARNTYSAFTGGSYTLINKINSTSKMITSSIISLPSSNHNGIYLWNDILNHLSYLGIIIFGIIIIGIIKMFKKKDKVHISMLLWFFYSFFIFMVLKWATNESPLFSIYFSWAIIPLFIYGLESLLEYLKIKKIKDYLFAIVIIFTFIINLSTIIDIYKFL